jgi:hypothetical protein
LTICIRVIVWANPWWGASVGVCVRLLSLVCIKCVTSGIVPVFELWRNGLWLYIY